ncbi:hypothetical protein DPMN_125416 [Dreissena polymorpha]|uniref:Uncharacterized protein n=1 Tax=Dreissena polymorpha TaxID=45954 RepID=A0A9D4H1D5_DREPO|nr:hypothetical protein DPMN_125416 [Dreissena polymorpha]
MVTHTGSPELLFNVRALFSDARSSVEAGLTGRSVRDQLLEMLFLKTKVKNLVGLSLDLENWA